MVTNHKEKIVFINIMFKSNLLQKRKPRFWKCLGLNNPGFEMSRGIAVEMKYFANVIFCLIFKQRIWSVTWGFQISSTAHNLDFALGPESEFYMQTENK